MKAIGDNSLLPLLQHEDGDESALIARASNAANPDGGITGVELFGKLLSRNLHLVFVPVEHQMGNMVGDRGQIRKRLLI